ncbi:hypothetical protein EVG20_g10461 [Dentipellis fragilis]|uniref:Uncharacterized protein n=1 Tax=Dentipellis fragilis TaxID=205917 RepID=A0A4Y9XRA3_9AGAM|nr:hypothetical protein EVG20_g10461 [Dentipellis fragilis]
MSTSTDHRRKRSLQESHVDLSKTNTALYRLRQLQAELEGIEETEAEMAAVMKHVNALEDILNDLTERIDFSAFNNNDLQVWYKGWLLRFQEELVDRARAFRRMYVVLELRWNILQIYNHVDMDHGAGARMVIDAVLLVLAEIAADAQNDTDVAILPGLRLMPEDGVQFFNPRLAFSVAQLENPDIRSLAFYIPEALSQAMAIIKTTRSSNARLYLSNGATWIFVVLASKDEQ